MPIISGGCDILGMHSGSVDGTDNSSVVYRGIEDIFGNIWQFVDGINVKDYQAYICYDKAQYEVDKFGGCYQKIGYSNNIYEGWTTKFGYDSSNPLISFPIEVITQLKSFDNKIDYYATKSGNMITLIGGSYLHAGSGLYFWSINVPSSEHGTHVTSRLLKTN